MRLGRSSGNIEDRRGLGGPVMAGGGIGALVIALVVMFLGGDPSEVLQQTGGPAAQQEGKVGVPQDEGGRFVSQVLADTEDTWNELFPREFGQNYKAPVVVIFDRAVQSACGVAQSSTGPFYCPLDQKVYIDLSFYNDLHQRFGAPGDFAQAYVIAHEVGHHIQTLLGISEQVHAARQRVSQEEANALSVRQELQADCLAGVWAFHAKTSRNVLEPGDLEEGLTAAAAIGDDRLQKQSQGYVVPESFTHGSSAQRVEWFKRGFETGQTSQCDTFGR